MKSKFVKIKNPDGIAALKALLDLPKSVSTLFHELLVMMDKTNALYATHDDLAGLCGVGITTLKKAINTLVGLKYIQTRRSCNGSFYSINANIATRCSHNVESYSAGYELWTCKVLVKRSESTETFNKTLGNQREINSLRSK